MVLQHVEDKVNDNIILKPEQLSNPCGDPWLNHIQVHLLHVNLTQGEGGGELLHGKC